MLFYSKMVALVRVYQFFESAQSGRDLKRGVVALLT